MCVRTSEIVLVNKRRWFFLSHVAGKKLMKNLYTVQMKIWKMHWKLLIIHTTYNTPTDSQPLPTRRFACFVKNRVSSLSQLTNKTHLHFFVWWYFVVVCWLVADAFACFVDVDAPKASCSVAVVVDWCVSSSLIPLSSCLC